MQDNMSLADWLEAETADFDAGRIERKGSSIEAAREQYPCEHCGGTGKFRAYGVGRVIGKCHPCNGRGYFHTTEADRRRARQARRNRKARKLEAARAAFDSEYPGLADFLAGATWSEFATSLYESIAKYGGLSEKQLTAALSMREKCEARQAERDAKRKAAEQSAPVFPSIPARFNAATESGLKYPKIRLTTAAGDPVKLQRNGDRSRYPGHVSVTDGGPFGANEYYGRIDLEGRFHATRKATGEIVDVLRVLNDNPDGAVKVQGQRTGNCCLCGRELTKHDSIDRGIGPICAGKWGF